MSMEEQIATAVVERLKAEGLVVVSQRKEKRVYSVEEAAEYLNRTGHAIRHLKKRGKLHSCGGERRVLFKAEELERFLNEGV